MDVQGTTILNEWPQGVASVDKWMLSIISKGMWDARGGAQMVVAVGMTIWH